MLHHGGDGDGGHDQDRGQVKLGDDKLLQAHKVGLAYLGEIHLTGDEGHNVAAHHTQQDGDDLHHALAPDVGHDDDGDGHQSQPPAGRGVGDGGAGEVQTDEDDNGAGDDGGEEAHDLLGAHQLEQQGQHQVQPAGDNDAAQGVGELFFTGHGGELARIQLGYRLEAAQEGEGGAQEGRDLELGTHMEQQRTQTRKQQCGLDGERQAVALHQDGNQHRGAEHGEQMLQAQHQHPGQAQGAGVVDGLIA